MNGIERLRKLAREQEEKSCSSVGKVRGRMMLDIADQIEREAGVETVRADAMEAWRWVRDHGGLDRIQTMVATLGDTLNWIRERIGLDKDEVVDYDELLDALDRRLMPEGVEWPRYDTGEPVRIDGTIADELGRAHEVTSVEIFDDAAALHWSPSEPEEFVWLVHGAPVRRPAKPEPTDSWERVEEDAGKSACTYFCHSDVTQPPNCGHDVRSCRVDMAEDLVRRCKALAERERSE